MNEEEEHAWRHANGTRLGEELKAEWGPLSEKELRLIWDVICQAVAIDQGISRETLRVGIIYARLKAKQDT